MCTSGGTWHHLKGIKTSLPKKVTWNTDICYPIKTEQKGRKWKSFIGGDYVINNRIWEVLGEIDGEGNGNPLQHSCLENPMDGGSWWATVHRVAGEIVQWSLEFSHFKKRTEWLAYYLSCIAAERALTSSLVLHLVSNPSLNEIGPLF